MHQLSARARSSQGSFGKEFRVATPAETFEDFKKGKFKPSGKLLTKNSCANCSSHALKTDKSGFFSYFKKYSSTNFRIK